MGQVTRSGAPVNSRLSQSLWADFPFAAVNAMSPAGDPLAWFVKEEFQGFGDSGAAVSTAGRYRGDAATYRSFETSGTSIAPYGTPVLNAPGIVRFNADNTTNHECYMQAGAAAGTFAALDDTSGNAGNQHLWYEARFRLPTQVASGSAVLMLAEAAAAAAGFIVDTTWAMADKAYIGWRVTGDAPTALKFVYHKASGTEQVIATVATVGADTFYKVGFKYVPSDAPNANTAKRIVIFQDGVEQTSYVTSTQMADTTNFPAGTTGLSPIFGAKAAASTAKLLDVDWWAMGGTLRA